MPCKMQHHTFICHIIHSQVTWFIHTWRDSFIRYMTHPYATWLIHVIMQLVEAGCVCDVRCESTHSNVRHDFPVCATTNSYVWHDLLMCEITHAYVVSLIHTPYVWHHSCNLCVTWRVRHTWDMRIQLIWVTWLIHRTWHDLFKYVWRDLLKLLYVWHGLAFVWRGLLIWCAARLLHLHHTWDMFYSTRIGDMIDTIRRLCDMTWRLRDMVYSTDVWHVLIITHETWRIQLDCVTWLIHCMYVMTYSSMRDISFKTHRLCDMTLRLHDMACSTDVCHYSSLLNWCVSWLLHHKWDVTYSTRIGDITHPTWVWHDELIVNATWLVHLCDMSTLGVSYDLTHSSAWHDSSFCDMPDSYPICKADMSNSHELV